MTTRSQWRVDIRVRGLQSAQPELGGAKFGMHLCLGLKLPRGGRQVAITSGRVTGTALCWDGQERWTTRQLMFPSRRKDSTEPTEPLRAMWESVTPAVTASGPLAFAVGPEGAVASSPPALVLPTRGERSPEAFDLGHSVHPRGHRALTSGFSGQKYRRPLAPRVLGVGKGSHESRGFLSSDKDGIWRKRQCGLRGGEL